MSEIGPKGRPPSGLPAESRIRHQLGQILESPSFRNSRRSSEFLRYVVEEALGGRQTALKERTIAQDVFGREQLDSDDDSIVRVAAREVRKRLAEYHLAARPEIRIELPSGSYIPEFIQVPAPAEAESGPDGRAAGRPVSRRALLAAVPAGAAAGAAATWALVHRTEDVAARRPVPDFWRPFLNGKPTTLFLPSAVFLRWEQHGIMARDLTVNRFEEYRKSPHLSALEERLGPPKLAQPFLFNLHVKTAFQLIQKLGEYGIAADVQPLDTASVDVLMQRNIIIPGLPYGRGHMESPPFARKYRAELLGDNRTLVRNLRPGPGEPAEYRDSQPAERHQLYPALVLQGTLRDQGSRILLIEAKDTVAVTTALFSPDTVRTLERKYAEAGRPEHFEVLLWLEAKNNELISCRVVDVAVLSPAQ